MEAPHVIRRTAAGFSIVEALVALVVLSVGMLGIAALYVESLRAGRSAVYRTQAVNLAADMADRIRSNREQPNAWALSATANPATQGCVAGTINCNPAQLAQDDQARWRAAISNQLPGDGANTPNGTIEVDDTVVPNEYTITVSWSEPGADEALTYVLTMQI
jgi:type IV pilus assembly protein PilV